MQDLIERLRKFADERVEIENPGGLPDGITKRDFGKSSVRRNPVIADLFHRMGKV